jgi:DNA-binding NarL/FixJ family response regulator
MEDWKKLPHKKTGNEKAASILVVDDSDIFRNRLVSLLNESALDATILPASDSRTAYILFQGKKPEIAILDIHIPGDNGIKVLEWIRTQDSKVMVIMLTSYPAEQYKKRCQSLGADAFLEKSDDMVKVVELCKQALDNKPHFK